MSWAVTLEEYYLKAEALEKAGHTKRCACRIAGGDGCCECGKDPNFDGSNPFELPAESDR